MTAKVRSESESESESKSKSTSEIKSEGRWAVLVTSQSLLAKLPLS